MDALGFVNDSQATIFIVSDDTDNDGHLDVEDTLIGILGDVSISGLGSFSMTVGGNNINDSFSGPQDMLFYDGGSLLINVSHNFSLANKILLDQVDITVTELGLIVNFNGQLLDGETKTLYAADNQYIGFCVKDAPVTSLGQITAGCSGANETDFTSCLGTTNVTINNITCDDLGSRIRVSGLSHSGVEGTWPSSGSSGGGGSSSSAPQSTPVVETPPVVPVVPVPPSPPPMTKTFFGFGCTKSGT